MAYAAPGPMGISKEGSMTPPDRRSAAKVRIEVRPAALDADVLPRDQRGGTAEEREGGGVERERERERERETDRQTERQRDRERERVRERERQRQRQRQRE